MQHPSKLRRWVLLWTNVFMSPNLYAYRNGHMRQSTRNWLPNIEYLGPCAYLIVFYVHQWREIVFVKTFVLLGHRPTLFNVAYVRCEIQDSSSTIQLFRVFFCFAFFKSTFSFRFHWILTSLVSSYTRSLVTDGNQLLARSVYVTHQTCDWQGGIKRSRRSW